MKKLYALVIVLLLCSAISTAQERVLYAYISFSHHLLSDAEDIQESSATGIFKLNCAGNIDTAYIKVQFEDYYTKQAERMWILDSFSVHFFNTKSETEASYKNVLKQAHFRKNKKLRKFTAFCQ